MVAMLRRKVRWNNTKRTRVVSTKLSTFGIPKPHTPLGKLLTAFEFRRLPPTFLVFKLHLLIGRGRRLVIQYIHSLSQSMDLTM